LPLAQLLDQPRPEEEGQQESGQRRESAAKGDVPEDVEQPHEAVERIEDMEEHQRPSPKAARAASTNRSMAIPREPFTRTRSPGSRSSSTDAAAAAESGNVRSEERPSREAPSAVSSARGPTATNRPIPARAACSPT